MIDFRVVNNLSHNKQAAVFENLTRGIRQIDRAFDAETETKLLRQAHGRISRRNGSAGATDLFDDVAAIV